MINSKIVLVGVVAMLAMAATTIVTQETYAAHRHGRVHVGGAGLGDGYCGTNWQGSFHISLGNPSLSIPAGMCMADRTSTLG
ncbi:MAG TPA: hypothetical protein VE971_00235 [Candidatus Eisenbacteria bacterium]|nr:hypothetical protein [Candidatus Eisenbacteria bacterium]